MWASRIFILCVAVTYVAAVQMHINGPVRIMHCSGERQDHRQLAGGIEEPLDFLEFYEAASNGDLDNIHAQLEKVRMINNGANRLLNWQNENDENQTALHIAIEKGHLPAVRLLLDLNPDLFVVDNDGYSIIHRAAAFGHEGIMEYLMKYVDFKDLTDDQLYDTVNQQAWDGWTPLYAAARWGNNDELKFLIRYQGDVNKLTNEGWSPLMRASRLGNEETVQILIDAGAQVKYAGPKGTTALHLAARSGHEEVAKLLLRNGADKYAENKKGQTAADWARDDDHDELAELIDNWKTSVIPQSAASAISK